MIAGNARQDIVWKCDKGFLIELIKKKLSETFVFDLYKRMYLTQSTALAKNVYLLLIVQFIESNTV